MARITLKNSPLLLATLPMIVGISLAHNLGQALSWVMVGAFALFSLVLVSIFRRRQWPRVAAVCFCFAALGVGVLYLATPAQMPLERDVRGTFTARIESSPTINQSSKSGKSSRWQVCHATILAHQDSVTQEWHTCNQGVQLYIDTSEVAVLGSKIVFTSKLRSIQGNYGKYMSRRGIMHNSWVYHIKGYAPNPDTTALQRLELLRTKLATRLNRADTSHLASALVVGRQSGMARSVIRPYRITGVSHLLSVSGLHVGIVFVMLNLLLGWLRLGRGWGIYTLGSLVILILWGYAAMTGFSVSVLRSVIMFSVAQVGLMFSKGNNSFNTLCFAAFVILLFWPLSLFDVGFQLSFLAVVGILVFYQPLRRLVNTRVPPLNWLWGLTSLTISAQICTLPLVAYYFEMAPLIGVVLNPLLWFTVPILIALGLLYLLVPFGVFGYIIGCVAWFQNWVVAQCGSWGWASFGVVKLSATGCLLLYLAIVALLAAVNHYDTPKHRSQEHVN